MSLTTNLKSLSNANGVSGDGGAVRKIVIDLIRDHVDDLRVDTIGNVLAVKRARGASSRRVRVMLSTASFNPTIARPGSHEPGRDPPPLPRPGPAIAY